MSVINQVLLNLERRAATPLERAGLPAHVQALPESPHFTHWGWVAGGAGCSALVLTGWIALTGTPADRNSSDVGSAGGFIERVVAATTGASHARIDDSGDGYGQELHAFRLSFELSNPPAGPPETPVSVAAQAPASKQPVSSAKIIGRKGVDSGTAALAASKSSKTSEKLAMVKPIPEAAFHPEIQKQVREPTPRELAEYQYRKAVMLLNQGRAAEAEEGFREALILYPEDHQARQGLVGLLVQGRKLEEAERVLEEGVKLSPAQIGFNITLARLLADRGEGSRAITTLENGLEYAKGSPEYSAFLAALLQRKGQHKEAIEHFQAALQARPRNGVWWVGLGISLQAANEPSAALDAYRHARASGNLHPDLTALVEQRLRQLQ